MPSDHAEVDLKNLRVPYSAILYEEGLVLAQRFIHKPHPAGGRQRQCGALLHRQIGGARGVAHCIWRAAVEAADDPVPAG